MIVKKFYTGFGLQDENWEQIACLIFFFSKGIGTGSHCSFLRTPIIHFAFQAPSILLAKREK